MDPCTESLRKQSCANQVMTALGTDSCSQRPCVIVTADTMQRKRNQQPNCLDFSQIPQQALCLILVGNTKLDKH